MEKNYYHENKQKYFAKLNIILKRLPSFCKIYFVGIESRTEILTRLNYAQDLLIFFDFICNELPSFNHKDPTALDFNHINKLTAIDIESFLSYLTCYYYEGKKHINNEKAKARKLSSIRSLFKYLYNKDFISGNVASKVATPKIHDKEIIRLDSEEINSMVENLDCDNVFPSDRQNSYNIRTKKRDNALITMMLATGIRVSECVGLNEDDIDLDTNSFLVTRKGGNRTILYFSNEVKQALESYMIVRDEMLKKRNLVKKNLPLFLSLQNNRLSVRAVQNIVKKYASISAPLKNISPHKLRSTYGTALYRSTKDIYVVAEVLGHKDINTTKKHYAAIGEDIKKEASNKVQLKKDK